ncbi:hypothetical protein FB446DRAFT_354646 [Lentinula raphanica]|nr:hypothetical protein FB446DRAFT_354646 [Lentinula raphanica]
MRQARSDSSILGVVNERISNEGPVPKLKVSCAQICCLLLVFLLQISLATDDLALELSFFTHLDRSSWDLSRPTYYYLPAPGLAVIMLISLQTSNLIYQDPKFQLQVPSNVCGDRHQPTTNLPLVFRSRTIDATDCG